MNLNEEQKAALAGWVKEGLGLSDIQKRLEADFAIRMTYMDLRFLIDDLDLEVKAPAPTFEQPKVQQPDQAVPHGKVAVRLDKVARPDALLSGQVTFSDGVTAQWHFDHMGRLSLNPKKPGYRPSQEDLREFQTELQEAASRAGMF